MLKNKSVFCDECGREILYLTEEEACADFPGHGWSNVLTAKDHICTTCSINKWEELWDQADPCGRCETQPCERGRDCWWNPSFGTYYDYETYFADRLETIEMRNLPELEDPEDDELKLKREKRLREIRAKHDPKQTKLYPALVDNDKKTSQNGKIAP